MATYEQCEKALKELFRTRQDVLDFCRRYQAGLHTTNPGWRTDADFIVGNIESLLRTAETRGQLDRLGRSLGIPTNAEQQRLSRIQQGVFRQGEEFDASTRIISLFNSAETSIVLIDSYVDEKLLQMLTGKKSGVTVSILTQNINPATRASADAFNKQYGGLSVRSAKGFHDRFIIIDGHDYYHSGHSIKDLGKATSALSQMTQDAIDKVRADFDSLWPTATIVV